MRPLFFGGLAGDDGVDASVGLAGEATAKWGGERATAAARQREKCRLPQITAGLCEQSAVN